MSDSAPVTNGEWREWSKYVLMELKRLNSCVESMQSDITSIKVELGMLKVRAGAWGALAGAIPGLLLFLHQLLKGSP